MLNILKSFLIIIFIANYIYAKEWKFANGPYRAQIRKMAINPIHPDTLYATGNGLFRTYDGGQNWLEIAPDSLIGNIESAVAIDPKYPNIIYYGNRALFKSYDFGSSWEITGFKGRKVTTITIDPVETNNIFVGLRDAHENGDALWLSKDSGKTWQLKTSGMPENITGCRAIEINPLNRDNIYAATTLSGLFKSMDGGETWTYKGFANLFLYDIAIAPWDTSIMFTATWAGLFKSKDGGSSWINVLNADIRSVEIEPQNRMVYAGLYWGDGVYKSSDYGETWQDINNPFLPTSYSEATWVFDIRINPKNPDIVYIGTGIGPYKTENAGDEWKQVFDGMKKFYAYDIKISPSDSNIVYATGRNGVHRSIDGGKSWLYIGGWTHHVVSIDQNNAEILYITGFAIDLYSYIDRTLDGGKTWDRLPLISVTGISFIEIDPNNSDRIYTATYDGFLCSENRGDNWTLINTPEMPVSLVISKQNDQILIIGTKNGVYKTFNRGESWELLGLSGYDKFTILDLHPKNESILLAAVYEYGVFKSEDGGKTWREKNDGLFDFNITRLIINPNYPDEILLGTETSGVFFSKNACESWKQLQPSHPSLRIDALCIDRDGKILCAGRDTAGIYILDSVLTSIKQEDVILNTTYLLEQNYPNPFNNVTSIEYFLPASGNVKIVVYDMLGQRIKILVNSYQTPGIYNVKWNGKDNSGNAVCSGLYFYQLTAGKKSLNSKMLLIK